MAMPQRSSGVVASALVSFAFAVAMLGTTLPTPLYALYRSAMGLSELMITVIFAAYAVGVLTALVITGNWSDQVGRRPLLLAGLALAAASTITFLIGGALLSLPALLVARTLSGLTAGIFTGTATAAVVELAPAERRDRAALVATTVNMGGLGLGPVLGGLLAEYAVLPLLLPYAIYLVLLGVAAPCVLVVPEVVETEGPVRLAPQRMAVPAEVRPVFVPAVIAGFAGFMVLGLFTAVAPALLAQIIGVTNHLFVGLIVFAIFAASTVGQVVQVWIPPRRALQLGCSVLILGAGLIGASVIAASMVLVLIGAVVAGLGQGLGFRAGVVGIQERSPAERRGEVTSTYFAVLYVAISIPVIGVGALTEGVGLVAASLVFVGVVAALSAVAFVVLLKRRG
jgi:MFS family permease